MSPSPSLCNKGSENTIFGKVESGSGKGKESKYMCKVRREEKEKKRVPTITSPPNKGENSGRAY
jgi:hypothetical protein